MIICFGFDSHGLYTYSVNMKFAEELEATSDTCSVNADSVDG